MLHGDRGHSGIPRRLDYLERVLGDHAGDIAANIRDQSHIPWVLGGMGTLFGIFVEDDEVVSQALGAEIYFGEVLGDHSEVAIQLGTKSLTVITQDQGFIEQALNLGLKSFGHNPIEKFKEHEERQKWREERKKSNLERMNYVGFTRLQFGRFNGV